MSRTRSHRRHRSRSRSKNRYHRSPNRSNSRKNHKKHISRSRYSRDRKSNSETRRHHRHSRSNFDSDARKNHRGYRTDVHRQRRNYSRDQSQRRYKEKRSYRNNHKNYKQDNYRIGHKDENRHNHHAKNHSNDNKHKQKDAGHFNYEIGDVLDERYEIREHLGDGTFGRVLEVYDSKRKHVYAMKVIRGIERYIESAQIEADILGKIKEKDVDGKSGIVRLEKTFSHKNNFFMLFEPLGPSLYDFIKGNNYRGFSITLIRSFTRQILKSVGFMHSIGLTHTDLKPENILLETKEKDLKSYQKDKRESTSPIGRSSTCSESREKVYFVPKSDVVKIIDMGGATWDSDSRDSLINTRQYRSPEVMLGCTKWGHESDVWSIGCILAELYTGELFFETHETYEHLAMIERVCGPIPYWMVDRANSKTQKYFVTSDKEHYEKNKTYLAWPKHAKSKDSIQRLEEFKNLEDLIPKEHQDFVDLIRKMLIIDPRNRITCKEALEHSFLVTEPKEES